MTESSRVQRWRQQLREQGKKAVTVWLTQNEELRLKDLALQAHCSPSALVQQALAQFHPGPAQSNGNVTDSLQIRKLIREELAAMQATLAPVTDTVTDIVTVTVPETPVRETSTDPHARMPCVTDTGNGDVTDTQAIPEAATPTQPRRGRQSGPLRQRILALLYEHSEGLSPEQIRVYLNPEKPIGDVLQGMRRAGIVHLRGEGYQKRYFVA